ncbi:MAG: hypothetical protein ACRC2R_18370 [Xenococcaceae cyanobacterium]
MHRFRWLRFLSSLGLEFWLPLPLVGLSFWLVIKLVADRDLYFAKFSDRQLQITQNEQPTSERIFSIKVTVDRASNSSRVRVKQATSVFQKQEFELPTTQFDRLETAIAQKLNLSIEQVRQLIRYQLGE